ncbi:MAG TPA: hypothetical protein VJR26_13230 [Candidatus Acidoferrales bacterium]|nr:hypothetical protein [Candidatus Acidoferrales bacterium]
MALQTLAVHVRIMGILWAIYGCFEIVMAFWTIGMSSVYFPLFQKLVAPAANSQLSPESLHTLFVFSGIFSLVTGALGLFAGWMLLRRERSGRAVALFAAFVSLIQLPLGTGLAIYTLVELLSSSAREKYVELLASGRPGREPGMEL